MWRAAVRNPGLAPHTRGTVRPCLNTGKGAPRRRTGRDGAAR